MVFLEVSPLVRKMKRIIEAHKDEAKRCRQQLAMISILLSRTLDPSTFCSVVLIQDCARRRLHRMLQGQWACVDKIIYFRRIERLQISFHEGYESALVVQESEIMNKQIILDDAVFARYTSNDPEWKNE